MKENKSVALSESCRLMRGSSWAELFRSGAANDESDGLARYSELELAVRQFGWQRGKVLVPLGMGAYFFYTKETRNETSI